MAVSVTGGLNRLDSLDRFNVRLLTSTFTCDKIFCSVSLRVLEQGVPQSVCFKKEAATTNPCSNNSPKHSGSGKSASPKENFMKFRTGRTHVLLNIINFSTFMIAQGVRATIASISFYPFPPPTPAQPARCSFALAMVGSGVNISSNYHIKLWLSPTRRIRASDVAAKDAIPQRELQISLVIRSKNKHI